jgi:hypothetical protein
MAELPDQATTLGALGAVGTAFVAMLRILARPETRWQPIVDQLEADNARLRAEVAVLREQIEQER